MKFVGQSINIIAHEEYEYRFRSSKDIALIRLNASVPFGPNIHPLPISTHSTADVEDCMLTGYGPDPNKEVEEGSGTLTTANLTNEADVDGTMQTLAVTFNDSRSTEGDSGSPIVCRVNGTMFAHGVHSIGREPPVAKGAKPMQHCTMQETNKAMAIPGITELIYLSYKHRTWQFKIEKVSLN
uniref:Peptidase S1 domain-containing protein n=1 Tax=Romanomermis culicivorax TaxID=13658 RepID=A0A915HWK8_ROMCU